mmetsp:Transcript_20591/g.50562  ORF Transcript_20591/g.50562 Transcript_20591/m.50562 type:complete len:268 (+) Transcript_20591:151-954(+)
MYDPMASPPSSAPPPPPSSADSRDARKSYSQHSYQNNVYQSRSAPMPSITNYGISPAHKSSKQSEIPDFENDSGSKANPDFRPNTGRTNDDVGGIGSLSEVVSRLRWATIATTLATIVWEGFALPSRLLIDAWINSARVVLAAYLGIFALMILGVELNAPMKDSFGVLYHPIGRSLLLFLMSSMCLGILEAWWEAALGICYFICGAGYVYAYFRYPEYQRWDDYNESEVWANMRTAIRRRTNPWADPSGRSNLASDWTTLEEAETLL